MAMDWDFYTGDIYTSVSNPDLARTCYWIFLHPDLEQFFDVVYDYENDPPAKLVPKNLQTKTAKLVNSPMFYQNSTFTSFGKAPTGEELVKLNIAIGGVAGTPMNQFYWKAPNYPSPPVYNTPTDNLSTTPSITVRESAPLHDQTRLNYFQLNSSYSQPVFVHTPTQEHIVPIVYKKIINHRQPFNYYRKYSLEGNYDNEKVYSDTPKKKKLKKENSETWITCDFIYQDASGKYTNSRGGSNKLIGQYNGVEKITTARNVIIDYLDEKYFTGEKQEGIIKLTSILGNAKKVNTLETTINNNFEDQLNASSVVGISGNYQNISIGTGGVYSGNKFAVDGVYPSTFSISGDKYTYLNDVPESVTTTNDWAMTHMGSPTVRFAIADEDAILINTYTCREINWTKKISESNLESAYTTGKVVEMGRYKMIFLNSALAGPGQVARGEQIHQDTPICVPLTHYTKPSHWDSAIGTTVGVSGADQLFVVWSNTGGYLVSANTYEQGLISNARDPRYLNSRFTTELKESNYNSWSPVMSPTISSGSGFAIKSGNLIHAFTTQEGTNFIFHSNRFLLPGQTPQPDGGFLGADDRIQENWATFGLIPSQCGNYGKYIGDEPSTLYISMGIFPNSIRYESGVPVETLWFKPTPYYRIFAQGDAKVEGMVGSIPADMIPRKILVDWTVMEEHFIQEGGTAPDAYYWGNYASGIWKKVIDLNSLNDAKSYKRIFIDICWTAPPESPQFGNNVAGNPYMDASGPQIAWYPFAIPRHPRIADSVAYPGIISPDCYEAVTDQTHEFDPSTFTLAGSIYGGNLTISNLISNFLTTSTIGTDVATLYPPASRMIKEITISDYDDPRVVYDWHYRHWVDTSKTGMLNIFTTVNMMTPVMDAETNAIPIQFRAFYGVLPTPITSIDKTRRIVININHINPFWSLKMPNLQMYKNWNEHIVIDVDGTKKKHWFTTASEGRTDILNNPLIGES